MVKRAAWIVSAAGLQALASAGITPGWLKAWLLSSGAAEVGLELLESGRWRQSDADWQLFFAAASELDEIALPQADCFELQNPRRSCRHGRLDGDRQVLLLPLGDIAYQRHGYLSRLHSEPPRPLHVLLGDAGNMPLEPGLSASLSEAAAGALNSEGLLIEEQVVTALRRKGLGFRSVESCTAGAIAARLARLPGASDVLDRAWVTYSNQSKCEQAHVAPDLLAAFGAVSEPVACAMAEGGSDERHACVAVSGIAGPEGGTADKPVGTVWIAVAVPGQKVVARRLQLAGSRSDIQAQTAVTALALLLASVG